MKLLLKILFFLLVIFNTNIFEARITFFDGEVSEVKHTVYDVEIKNKSVEISENDFGISCKSKSKLVDYRNLAKCCEANAAKGGVQYTKSSLQLGGNVPAVLVACFEPPKLLIINKN